MPIYAYRCESCGFAKDVLQKVSDAPLTVCPTCEKPAFKKQLTAAGFQLKGTGWYVTDFRGGSGGSGASAAKPTSDKPAADAAASGGESKSEGKSKSAGTDAKTPAADTKSTAT